MFLRSALTQVASSLIPPLPGAQMTSETRGDWRTFHASACSRPPLPRIRTFIPISSNQQVRWELVRMSNGKSSSQFSVLSCACPNKNADDGGVLAGWQKYSVSGIQRLEKKAVLRRRGGDLLRQSHAVMPLIGS